MVEDAVGEVVQFVGRAALDVVFEFIFSKHGARYFHGIGRIVIGVATLGLVRIPSSLRQVHKGIKPKPNLSDWVALFVGIVIFTASVGIVIWSYFE